jgi:hypothetical protein
VIWGAEPCSSRHSIWHPAKPQWCNLRWILITLAWARFYECCKGVEVLKVEVSFESWNVCKAVRVQMNSVAHETSYEKGPARLLCLAIKSRSPGITPSGRPVPETEGLVLMPLQMTETTKETIILRSSSTPHHWSFCEHDVYALSTSISPPLLPPSMPPLLGMKERAAWDAHTLYILLLASTE